jgi:lysophosphatidylcholine acyltransferase / lyso-PAF acetyltransferase
LLADTDLFFSAAVRLPVLCEGWRRVLRFPVVVCVRGLLFAFGFMWVSEEGSPAPLEDAPVVIANHTTFVEPVYFAARIGATFIASADKASLPVAGAVLHVAQAILVDRQSADSRHATVDALKARAADAPRWATPVMLFPEGTTTNGRALIGFKAGAFLCGRPVQPCIVSYPFDHCDPCWVADGPSLYALLWRLGCQFYNRMTVRYLPVYKPSPAELADTMLFARNVRAVMARAMGVPITEHSFDDVLLMVKAAELRLPPSQFDVELAPLSKLLDVRIDRVKELLAAFAKIDVRRTGKVNAEEFMQAMGLHNNPLRERLFQLLDQNGTGEIGTER